ncbi:MAG: hypothetical protein Q7R55_00210 [Candidatus Wildermuthbacteria bacterium]|nr:hypothetical protein [Candidatus Wildermuthbacteria bacterium]
MMYIVFSEGRGRSCFSLAYKEDAVDAGSLTPSWVEQQRMWPLDLAQQLGGIRSKLIELEGAQEEQVTRREAAASGVVELSRRLGEIETEFRKRDEGLWNTDRVLAELKGSVDRLSEQLGSHEAVEQNRFRSPTRWPPIRPAVEARPDTSQAADPVKEGRRWPRFWRKGEAVEGS